MFYPEPDWVLSKLTLQELRDEIGLPVEVGWNGDQDGTILVVEGEDEYVAYAFCDWDPRAMLKDLLALPSRK